MCVGFLYTLTCMRPRTLVVVVSKKESLLDDREILVRNPSKARMAVVHVSVPPSRRMNSCGNCSFFYVLHHQVSDWGTHGRSHGTDKRLLVMFLFVSEEAVSLRWL